MKSILIATNKGITEINLQNIVRIQSCSNYSKIFFADKTYPLTVAKLLQWFEEKLPADFFVRTHRTHLVNQKHILKISLETKQIHLSNGEQIIISKRRKELVKQRLCA
jgi:two-component system LytT family response regulator